MASSCIYYVPKFGSTSLCDQNTGLQSADRQTHRHMPHGQTKKVTSYQITSFTLRLLSLVVQYLVFVFIDKISIKDAIFPPAAAVYKKDNEPLYDHDNVLHLLRFIRNTVTTCLLFIVFMSQEMYGNRLFHFLLGCLHYDRFNIM